MVSDLICATAVSEGSPASSSSCPAFAEVLIHVCQSMQICVKFCNSFAGKAFHLLEN